jgi:hypothetical protein
VLEYRSDEHPENPELMLLEIGGVTLPDFKGVRNEDQARAIEQAAARKSRDGGWVMMLQGANVGSQDVDLLPC